MTKQLAFGLILIFATILLVQQQPLAWAAASIQAATPTPQAEEEEADALTLEALAARLDALQAQVDEMAVVMMHHNEEMAAMMEEHHEGVADGYAHTVATALYLLDTAGLHDLDVRLNEEKALQPADAGRVAPIARLLSSVTWPDELATDAANLIDVLEQLAAALGDDDLENAAPLATQAHEVQHDFSHAAEQWLGEMGAPAEIDDKAGQSFRVTSAVYLLDTAGLHDLDVRLNEEKTLQPSDAGRVARLARLLTTVDWPAPLATQAMTLTQVLHDLTSALTDDDLATAAPLATQAHEVQHDLSHAAEQWLHEAMGEPGHHEEGASNNHAEAGDHHAEEGEEKEDGGHNHGSGG
jgi:hypothetical protein